MRWLPQSLASRVTALYAVTLLAFVGLGTGIFYQYEYRQHVEDAQVAADRLLDVVAPAIADSAVIGDYDTIHRTLEKSFTTAPFASAAFIDTAGGVVRVVTAAARPPTAPPRWLIEQVRAQLYDVNRNVSVGGQDYGVVRLTFDPAAVAADFWELALVVLVVAACSLMGGMLLIHIPLRIWLGTLDRMQSFDRGLAQGVVDPHKVSAEDAPLEFRRTLEVLNRTAVSLQAQQERAAVTLSAIADGVLTADAAGVVLYANPASAEMFGLPDRILVGMALRDLVPQAFAEAPPATAWRGRRLMLARRDKQSRVIDTTLSPIAAPDGAVAGHVLACRDVTEAHALEARVREELALRQGALDSLRGVLEGLRPEGGSPDPANDDLQSMSTLVAQLVRDREASRRALDQQKFALDQHAIVSIADADGRIVYANERFCAMSGYTLPEVIGQTYALVRSGLQPPELYRTMAATIAEGHVWQGELCNRSKDGTLHWFNTSIVPLPGLDAAGAQYISISTDISRRKEAEAELHEAKEAAEAASRAKSEFLANMSHEIRTPMNGIIGMSELALETTLTAEQRDYLNVVKTSAHALLTVINDILDFSRIEAGKMLIETIAFDLRQVTADAVRLLEFRAREKGLALQYAIDSDIPMRVVGDPARLRQVLVNLVGNAIKFTAEGSVDIAVAVDERYGQRCRLRFSVRDTGIGIAPDKQKQIFDAFVQEDATTSRRFGGTGLGLSICKRLVQLMGGDIWLASERGAGSTFHFVVDLGVVPAMTGTEEPLRLAGRPVLVVDDDAANRAALTRALQGWGMSIETADSGAAALDCILRRREPYACMLLDACMPDMDGFELAAVLGGPAYAGLRPPVVMLSSSDRSDAHEHSRTLGVVRYLTKPVATDLLEAALRVAIEGEPAIANASAPEGGVGTDRAVATAEADTPVPSAAGDPPSAKRILLVEDNPVNQQYAQIVLKRRGYDVTLANNGREAIAAMARDRFDLVLMDMQMPVMDGLQATAFIRTRERELGLPRSLIIAMTANAMSRDRDACLAAGMDDYMSKPIAVKALEAHLEAALHA